MSCLSPGPPLKTEGWLTAMGEAADISSGWGARLGGAGSSQGGLRTGRSGFLVKERDGKAEQVPVTGYVGR